MRTVLLKLMTCGIATILSVPVIAQEPEQPPAPNQFPQPLFITSHPSLFTVPDASQAFEKKMYEEPNFLPPHLYDPNALEGEFPNAAAPGSHIQQTEYPTLSSAADDVDPEGHYSEPRWNPFPYLTEQLACLPREERGLIIKETIFTDTVLTPSGDDYYMNTLDVRTKFYFGQAPFVQFTPRFGWNVIGNGGPSGLPTQLVEAGLDTSIYLPLSETWAFLATVGPNIFTDGDNTTSDAFRITATALAFYQWSDQTKIAAGFLYLDRVDVTALPAGGIFYTPSDDMKIEMFFPRPKIAYRFQHGEGFDRWCYLAGELGGGSWAMQHDNGVDDVVTLRDYRLIAGIEHIEADNYRFLFEAGFVFGRKIEYNTLGGKISPSPTAMLRGGLAF